MGNKLNCLANDPEANPPPKGRPIECADPGEEEPNPVAEKEEEKEEAPKGADAAAGTAPSKIRLLVCNNFQIDITADGFGICKCGHEKSAHSFPKDGQVCQPAEADNRKGLFETVAGAVACRNDDEPQEEQSESRVSILQKSLKSQVEDEYISEERGSTRQREEAKKLKETVKAESRASVWAERASLHTANQGILQGTIEKEKRLSVQVSHAWAKWIARGEKKGPSFVPPFGALTKFVPFPLDCLVEGEHGCELRAAGRGEEPCECYELGVQHRRCGQEERNVEGAGRGASKETGGHSG